MIIVTGAAGFIGSCLVGELNRKGHENLILVDHFEDPAKLQNLEGKKFDQQINRDVFVEWFKINADSVDFVFHIGARTDTTEFDRDLFDKLNLNYTKALWQICSEHQVPLVYASSAATYGLGEFGYEDNHDVIPKLQPLNPYGDSKNDFDVWALKQDKQPPFWAGLKFFNVYGPNEYHKGRMASVIFHAFNQIKEKGEVKLFRSHKEEYKDGEQLRDFVYVKDVVSVCLFLLENKPNNGIYNLGSGKARSFKDLVLQTFKSLNQEPKIVFIDTPEDIREKYQYFTEAKMQKLANAGYTKPFHTLEEGIEDYAVHYLSQNLYI